MSVRPLLPGLLLAGVLTLLATGLASVLRGLFGASWLDPILLALLLGLATANLVSLPGKVEPGARFAGKVLLDFAVALLGATLSWAAVAALGLHVFALVALVVAVGFGLAYLIGRAVGLGRRLALLIAAGNAICGNSAIAAVAPLVGARQQEIAAAIALTALIGVASVLLLPLAVIVFGLALPSYAVLAGLTVYAVPQVVAAAAPFGTATLALATLVKLARVTMLAPLTLFLSVAGHGLGAEGEERRRPTLFLPWFILAFAGLATLRSFGLLGESLAEWLGFLSKQLAAVAMAALGLQVRVAALREVGPAVALASALAALVMLVLAVGAIQFL